MNFNQIILYEHNVDERYYPFSVMHPLWELRVGALRIFEKYQRQFPEIKTNYYSDRKLHLDSFLERFEFNNEIESGENTLLLDSQVIPDKNLFKQLESIETENSIKLVSENEIIGFIIQNSDEVKLESYFNEELERVELKEINKLNYIWDAIYLNGRSIVEDSKYFADYERLDESKYKGVYGVNTDKIYIGNNVKISPNVVLDATEGEIIVDDNAEIFPNSTIIGPVYIGKNSKIKAGAKIYENTSIGEVCKVGGEVEESIIQSYSNKQHDGFLGHSFLSEWVNIGADTNTSDLKNTYSDITVIQRDNEINTGKMFLGLLCGDHTKTAINTQFNTGTIAGICGILVKPGFLPRSIKSFSWGGAISSPLYKLDKAAEVADTVKKRRDKNLTQLEKELFRKEYERIK